MGLLQVIGPLLHSWVDVHGLLSAPQQSAVHGCNHTQHVAAVTQKVESPAKKKDERQLEQVAQFERGQSCCRHSRARAGPQVQHGAKAKPQHAHACEGQSQPSIKRAIDELAGAPLQCLGAG